MARKAKKRVLDVKTIQHMTPDLQAAEFAIGVMLQAFGHNLDSEGMCETPKRFVKLLAEFHQPFDIKAILKNGFAAPKDPGIVAETGIPFRALCEHHLAPMTGHAAIGYIPGKRIVGLSKLPRLVRAVGLEKPGVQEAIGQRICDLLHDGIEARGTIVVLRAEHTCMSCRGVATPGVMTTTSSVKGIFRDNPAARQEFFDIISKGIGL